MQGEAGDDERILAPTPRHTPLWAVLSRWLLALESWLRSHGGARLRAGLVAFWGVVALVGGILLLGPVINPPPTLEDITDSASTATDTWIARDFDVDYTLSRDGDGRLVADVVETIEAFFPDDVDESGIVRVLPTQYQGHALEPSGIEATVDGRPAAIGRSESSDRLTLRLTPADTDTDTDTDSVSGSGPDARLDGDHEFVISYRLHDLAYATTDAATVSDGDGADGDPVDLLAWDVFGPSWPQALAGLDVSVTLPDELDDALVRQPRGALAWTLLSAGEWLEPEPGSAPGTVTYGFTNDQNIPPNANARFTMLFEPGTFTMPPPTALFLVQSFGPLLPLVFLVLTALFALAARAVAWSDDRGRDWYVAQSQPPDGVSARLAAQLLRTPRTLELAAALDAGSSSTSTRSERLHAVARAARRTGRVGDRIRSLLAYLTAPERRTQLTEGLRRIPSGFVRDFFVAAPIAITLVQWGLVRQLSHQATLAVVWWPVAFVLASSLISIVVLAIALSARPLTRAGALVVQHLAGIAVYAERTALLERTTVTDRLLPFAVLTAEPRVAGRHTLALVETALGETGAQASRGWRTRDFLSAPRILIRVVAVVLFAASVTAAAVLPNPYPRSPEHSSSSGDLPGTYWNKVTAFDTAASVTVDGDRRATLTATERITVDFGLESSSEVPQFARQWPTRLDGQELGLRVTSVQLDGTDARYSAVREGDTVLLVTRFTTVLSGSHDLTVTYTVDSPVVAATGSGASADAGTVDRLRWVALLEDWDYGPPWDDDPSASPFTLSLTVPSDLPAPPRAAGWISLDTETADSPRAWEDSVVPFGTYPPGSDPSGTTDEVAVADGTTTYRLDLREADNGYPFELTVDDVGAMLDFPAGTFAGPNPSALTEQSIRSAFPLALVVALGLVALALGVAAAGAAAARGSRHAPPGAFRDLIWWLGTSTALSTVWLMVWSTSDMPDDWPEFPPLGVAALAAIAGGILSLVCTMGRRPTGRRP